MITDKKDIALNLEYLKAQDSKSRDSIISNATPQLRELIDKGSNLRPKHLDYDLAFNLYLEGCKKHCDNFRVDENNNKTIQNIVRYTIRDEKFLRLRNGNSFEKGLLIRGKVGSGKTILLRGYGSFLLNFGTADYWKSLRIQLEEIPAYAIAEAYAIKGPEILSTRIEWNGNKISLTDRNHLFVDDIGLEPIMKYYGSDANIIAEVMLRRYDSKGKTHATTNLDADSLKKLYGERVYSRMRTMFNDVILMGGDRRI